MHIAVLGAGAWGTALAAHAARRHTVTLWGRNPTTVAAINTDHENPLYLPGIALPHSLKASADLDQILKQKIDLAIIATPLAGLASLCREIVALECVPKRLIWVCKGVEPDTLALPHQIIQREFKSAATLIGTLSGPSFAEEVAQNLPCALVAAAHDQILISTIQNAFHHHNMRIYSSSDMIGVELSGAIKNVLAIATGINDGLKLGLNARAALITRGLAEISRLGLALGGQVATFMGLAGMGDLILTTTGDLSRNRQVGLRLAQGKPLDAILQELGHVAEGVRCAQAISLLAQQHNIEMPICTAVNHILTGHRSIANVVQDLLARDPKADSLYMH